MIRVIIADDEKLICRLVQALADWDSLGMEVAGTAENGLEALQLVEALEPDAVIVAVGSVPNVPALPGADGPHVMLGVDVFGREEQVGGQVVVVGGGQVGCELAIHLGERGCVLTVLEMGEYLAADAKLSSRLHVLRQMERTPGVSFRTQTRCLAITPEGVQAENEKGEEVFLPADTVVLCTGMKARARERDAFLGVAFDVIPVGDCQRPGLVKDAIHSGFNAALSLHAFE